MLMIPIWKNCWNKSKYIFGLCLLQWIYTESYKQ